MAGKGGLIALVLGVAAAGAAVAFSKKSSASSGTIMPGAPGSYVVGTGKYDEPGGPRMPLDLEHTVDAELANDTNPMTLLELSKSLRPNWPKAADLLEQKGATLAIAPSPAPPTPAPAPIPMPPPPPLPPVPPPTPTPPYVPPPYVPPPYVPPPYVPPPYVPPPAPPPAPAPMPEPAPTAGVPLWDSTLTLPSFLPSIPAHFATANQQHKDVQAALNEWRNEVGAPFAPLTPDGKIGPLSQKMTVAFQAWCNRFRGRNLTLDGLPGDLTMAPLIEFGDITSDAAG